MKRPLEDLPPLAPAHRHALEKQLATHWLENPARAFKIGFRKAAQLPLHCIPHHTDISLMTFRDRAQVFDALGIARQGALLQSEERFYFPPAAPAIDDSPYFAQWAAAWEPLSGELPVPLKYDRTLIVEIGAGFHLLSLLFTPEQPSRDAPHALKLDRLSLRQGHDVFALPASVSGDDNTDQHNIARADALLRVARDTIETIHNDYPMAETTLGDGLRPFIEALRPPPSLTHPQARPLVAPAVPRDPPPPGRPASQEP